MKKKNGLRKKIINELMDFFENVLVPYMDKEFGRVNGRLNNVEVDIKELKSAMQEVKTEIMYMKNDLRDLKADMPTKEEFETVRKLEKIHQKELIAFT